MPQYTYLKYRIPGRCLYKRKKIYIFYKLPINQKYRKTKKPSVRRSTIRIFYVLDLQLFSFGVIMPTIIRTL